MAVRGLFAASPSQLALLKQGEQEKQKSYVAVRTARLFWGLERLAAGLQACGMHVVSARAAAQLVAAGDCPAHLPCPALLSVVGCQFH